MFAISMLLFSVVAFAQGDKHADLKNNYGIVLDKGKKWKVPETMMIHIRNIKNDLQVFQSDKNKDYKALSGKLNANISLLTSNCTMEGRGHDELHKWLIPFIDKSKEFAAENDKGKQEELYQYLKKSIAVINKFFK